MTSEFQRK